jgi:hypothetical protein
MVRSCWQGVVTLASRCINLFKVDINAVSGYFPFGLAVGKPPPTEFQSSCNSTKDTINSNAWLRCAHSTPASLLRKVGVLPSTSTKMVAESYNMSSRSTDSAASKLCMLKTSNQALNTVRETLRAFPYLAAKYSGKSGIQAARQGDDCFLNVFGIKSLSYHHINIRFGVVISMEPIWRASRSTCLRAWKYQRSRTISTTSSSPHRPSLLASLAKSATKTSRSSQRSWTSVAPRSHVSAADLQFGQPLHESHPHLIQAGEITPGITSQEYANRRQRLCSLLPAGSVAILPAAELKFRSGPVFHRFHQDPDFLYLTGFDEPEALCIIDKRDGDDPVFRMLVREKDSRAEMWEGARSGVQAAMDVFNADDAADIARLPVLLPEMTKGARYVFTDASRLFEPRTPFARYLSSTPATSSAGLMAHLRELREQEMGVSVKPLRPLMSQLRVVKSESEILNMRQAGRISGRAFTAAMKREWTGERELWNYLAYEFVRGGCDSEAYVPVVAGGQVSKPNPFNPMLFY